MCDVIHAFTAPRNAKLFASVAEDVKTISRDSAPMAFATLFLETKSAREDAWPNEWRDPGFPNASTKNGFIAWRTRGSTGVDAA